MSKTHRVLNGLHVQFPWSQHLLSGKKTIETRSYPLPQKHVGIELALIETPGPKGRAAGVEKSRIIGTIVFERSFRYESLEQWLKDKGLHLVSPSDAQFRFKSEKPKYGWVVKEAKPLVLPCKPPEKRGIVFAANCKIPSV